MEQNHFSELGLLDKKFENCDKEDFKLPKYNSKTHYIEITNSRYFEALSILRHAIKKSSDFYWAEIQSAINVDLFMMTPSISSPMGPGSDSEAVSIEFGRLSTYLVDSSQFGFEPIIMGGINKVYCYLPSMRGENPDKRHLNQFYHCEVECRGELNQLKPQIEGYVKFLSKTLITMKNIVSLLSLDSDKTFKALESIVRQEKFLEIEFDDAIRILEENGFQECINITKYGKDINSKGEFELMNSLNTNLPVWVKNYDRDRVAFYQKPSPLNDDKVINADLIFPSLTENSFSGEIIGCGQRQDNYEEMVESLRRQGISSDTYEWYMNLRKLPNYSVTSGFGLGIERFITWSLCRDDIKDSILYPRLKNVLSHP